MISKLLATVDLAPALAGNDPLMQQIHQTPILVLGVLDLCFAITFFALWRAAPDFKVFRAAGLFFGLVTVVQFFDYFYPSHVAAIRPLPALFAVEIALEALQIRRRAWARLIWPITALAYVLRLFPSTAHLQVSPILLSQPIFVALIVIGFSRRSTRDRFIAVALTALTLVRMTLAPGFRQFTGISNYLLIRGWEWAYTSMVVTIFGAVTLSLFIRDLIQDRREKQRFASELEAARIVQQVLIPNQTPEVAGFLVASTYRPFGEVGGDFFQILPTPDGGVLIAIGDVSGKGLPAAMHVSLLVGTLLALCRYTIQPRELLLGLNEQLIGRSSGGFTTCLILRADRDGLVTAANAGHIGPYVNGKEFVLENGLPLGLVSEPNYCESTFSMTHSDQLTLVTDGIVEARSAAGELFGFERTQAISQEPAEFIADSAQSFGQEDDITVLSLRYTLAMKSGFSEVT